MTDCIATDCPRQAKWKGLCGAHYSASRRGTYNPVTGEDLRSGGRGLGIEEWLRRNTEVADCWIWTGPVNPGGYGLCSRKTWGSGLAHRATYMALVGDPGPLDLDHRCRVRRCVNPDHLEPVTRKVNLDRGSGSFASGRCRHGHEPSKRRRTPSGQTYCQECRRLSKVRRATT